MIKQQFYFNESEILRLYHIGFDDYPRERDVVQLESITEGVLEFREYWIENIEDEEINFDNIANGFLSSNETKNPYSDLCCDYQELITYKMDLIKEGNFRNFKQFNEICDFVKKWCGYDLKNSPFSINNTLIFTPTKVNIDSTLDKENERILNFTITRNGYGELTCIVKFKQNFNIVDTRIIQVTNQKVSIESRKDWSTVDIELFASEQLVYAYYDLSFIKSINMNMGITTKQVEMKLQHADKTITLENVVSEPIKIGDSAISNELVSYGYQEQLTRKKLSNKRRFEFLTKGQYERGLDIFSEIAGSHGYKEMWVFDPYFITYETKGGKARLNDIMKVLGKNLSLKKKIVFEVKEDDSQTAFSDFKEAIQETVDYLKKKKISLQFSFLGTKEHFHDRFIFLKNDYRLKAFLLGTSFNSFGDNYSTIIELDHLNGQMVFDALTNDVIDPNHILINEDLK